MQNRLILCVGFRGSGKSTVASAILKPHNGVFVFDPHGDDAYRWIPNTARDLEELEDYSRWYGEAKPQKSALRYVPDGRLDPFEALNDWCAWAWTWRNCWLCIEEVSEGTRNTSAAGMPPELRRIVNQGRHRRINQVYCGLRYAEIPRSISAGSDVQVIFPCREPRDLDVMANRIGTEAVERVAELRRYEALIFFPDRSFLVVGSREERIADLVMLESAPDAVSADKA
ncbi:MAG TPA: hypothetical protein VNJ52_04785 [Patescibacteria group bacterium]|nr:hypothetical protein [Patescibacteria group bacterium]